MFCLGYGVCLFVWVVFWLFFVERDTTQNVKQNLRETCKPTGTYIETRKKNASSDPCEAILLN